MEVVRNLVVNHPKKIAAFAVGLILVVSVFVFFSQNTIVWLSVASVDGVYRDKNAPVQVKLGSKELGSTQIDTSRIFVFPKTTATIELTTGHESTIQKYSPGSLFSKLSYTLSPQGGAKKVSTWGGGCVYDSKNAVYTWECDTLDSNFTKVTYDDKSFPEPSQLNIDDVSYAQMHKNGALGLNKNKFETELMYVDFSKNKPVLQSLAVPGFSSNSTYISTNNNGDSSFVIVDIEQGTYIHFEKGFTTKLPPQKKLPSYVREDEQSALLQLEDNTLSVLFTRSATSQDIHGAGDQELQTIPEEVRLVQYSLGDNTIEASNSLPGNTQCDEYAVLDGYIACLDNTLLSLYTESDQEEVLIVDNIRSIAKYKSELIAVYNNGVYTFNPKTNSLDAIYYSADQSVGDISLANGRLLASSWFERLPGAEQRIVVEVQPEGQASYPRLEDSLPLPYDANRSILDVDYFNKTIYISAYVPGVYTPIGDTKQPDSVVDKAKDEVVESIKNTLRDRGIDTDQYKLLFFY